jgi:hypothetical protein
MNLPPKPRTRPLAELRPTPTDAFARAVYYESLKSAKCPDVVEMWLFRHRFNTLWGYHLWRAILVIPRPFVPPPL